MEERKTTTDAYSIEQEPYFLPLYCPHDVWLANILAPRPNPLDPAPGFPPIAPEFLQQLKHRRCIQCRETAEP